MLRTATFLSRQGLFNRLVNPGKIAPMIVKNRKKLRPIKGMSTGCDKDPDPICSPEPTLMDYGPEHIGCWKENYDKLNKKANRDLALGFISLVISFTVLYKVGFIKGYDDFSFFETAFETDD